MPSMDLASMNTDKVSVEFNIICEVDEDGVKSNPSIPKIELSMGGLAFEMFIDKSQFTDYPYGVILKLTDQCKASLAAGFRLALTCTKTTWKNTQGKVAEDAQPHNYILTRSRPLAEVESFNLQIVHYTFDFQISMEDVYPHRLPFLELKLAEKQHFDLEIVIKGEKSSRIFVHKGVLCMHSPVFYAMFTGNYVEKDQVIVELGDVTVTDFLEYLYRLYPPCRPFAYRRMGAILSMADRFANDPLLFESQKFLLGLKLEDFAMKQQLLRWANQYRMPALFDYALSNMDKVELQALKPLKSFGFSPENLEKLIERLQEL